MGQTVVRGNTTVKRIRQGSTLSGKIISTKSLIQYLTKDTDVVLPDWTVLDNQPTLYLSVRSSLSTEMITDITNVEWFFEDERITSNDTRFEIGSYSVGGNSIPSLKIKDNIMLGATSNKTIEAVYKVNSGGVKTELSSTIDIQFQVTSDTAYIGEIGATNGGVITTETPNIVLNSALFKGGQPVSDYTIEWWTVVANDTDGTPDGLTNTGLTDKEITLTKDDVELMETYVAKFKVGGSLVATKTFDVRDETDPYVVKFGHSVPILSVGQTDVITASVVGRGSNTPISSFNHFTFSLMNGLTQIGNSQAGSNNQFGVEYSVLENNDIDELDVIVEIKEV